MNFLPPPAAPTLPSAREEASAPATARPAVGATRARKLAPAAVSASDLKAARCLWRAVAEGILSKCVHGVKILGSGELTKKLTVKASAFSASAKEKIEAAGGKAEVV